MSTRQKLQWSSEYPTEEGWELCAVIPRHEFGHTLHLTSYVLKRPKETKDD